MYELTDFGVLELVVDTSNARFDSRADTNSFHKKLLGRPIFQILF